jgi:hypothetical protein
MLTGLELSRIVSYSKPQDLLPTLGPYFFRVRIVLGFTASQVSQHGSSHLASRHAFR